MTPEQIHEIMEVGCDLCRWPYEARNNDHLDEICDNCPLLAALNDLEEPKHGKWEHFENVEPPYMCSVCHNHEDTDSSYCPSCGAKMEVDT